MPYSSAPSLKARNSRIEVSAPASEPRGVAAVAVAVLRAVKAGLQTGWGSNGLAVEPPVGSPSIGRGIFGVDATAPMRE